MYTNIKLNICFCCWCSVAKSCQTLHEPMDCSMPGFPIPHCLLEFTPKFVSIESVIPSNHLILYHPLLLLPSIFPSIRVFSNESALSFWWSKYWSFNFSISLSKELSEFISFRIDWFDFLAFEGMLKSLHQHHSLKASILLRSVQPHIQTWLLARS